MELQFSDRTQQLRGTQTRKSYKRTAWQIVHLMQ